MYPDVDERKIMLNKLHNLENLIWLSIDGSKKIIAVSDEDLERTRDEKTSAVHFLRFQLTKSDIKLFKASENIEFGVNHDNYNQSVKISKDTILALSNDLDG